MGRGVRAIRDIQSEEEIIRVPLSMVFSVASLVKSEDAAHRQLVEAFGSENDEQVVISALLLEKCRGALSRFTQYIKVLPKYVPNASYFSRSALTALQQPELERDVLESQERLVQMFPLFLQTIRPFLQNQLTLDDYRWASSIVDSRGLRFKGKIFLVPLADMFNYAPHPSVRPANSGIFFLEHHVLREEEAELRILADRNVVAGAQVFEDYGDNNDKVYLQYHGFVPERNPFRCVVITAPEMSSLALYQEDLARLLRFSHPPQQCIDEQGNLGEGMIVYHAVASFSPEAANACSALAKQKLSWPELSSRCGFRKIQDDIQTTGKRMRGDLSTLTAIYKSLVKHLHQMTLAEKDRGWVTTIEQDEELLRSLASADAQHILAVRHRILRKRLMKSLVEKFKPLEEVAQSDAIRSLSQKLDQFNSWFEAAGPAPNKLVASHVSGFRIATIAKERIESGENYLGVPVRVVLDSNVAWNHEVVGPVLKSLSTHYNDARDDFHELLLFLLYEYFVAKSDSFFWPYLALLPTREELDIPVLWGDDETLQTRLAPSHVLRSIVEYQNKTRKSFELLSALEPAATFWVELKSEEAVWTWENYQWATAILDSRSIWWDGKRHLVPMLDFINCAEGPNPSKVHSTALDDSGRNAVTFSSWAFSPGDQVFENYGQPNSIYFTYHGFSLSLEQNTHDCVEHHLELSADEIRAIDWAANDGTAREIAHRLGFRSKPSLSSCLKVPVPFTVWMFFALKTNTFREQVEANTLGRPFAKAQQLLTTDIQQRLAQYKGHNNNAGDYHAPSATFLMTEERHLQRILLSLTVQQEQTQEIFPS
jgi:histone-lysine N-methyltransferase SETD3